MHEWLVVLAADAIEDFGYVASIGRTDAGERNLGSRAEWRYERRVAFETHISDGLRPFYVATLHVLREGVRSAELRRPRQSRRARR